MLTDQQLMALLRDIEADNAERTRSAQNADKIGEAICAFANDLPDRRETGVLFIGVEDDGACSRLDISDQLLLTLLSFGRDGRIVPLPVMTARRVVLENCEMAIVEVKPSDNPPVKYNGRVCVRRGPQRGYATPEEERRLTEKRRWGNLTFDLHGVRGTTLEDIDLARFESEYLPAAIAHDVLRQNHRDKIEQLKALRLVTQDNIPTVTGILVTGKNPLQWLPGAYVQFVRYPGSEIGDVIRDQKQIDGTMVDILLRIDEVIEANITVAANLSGKMEQKFPDYPIIALQEIIRNAVIHRNYEATSTPVRITWYDDRVEIVSPGGPYGTVTIQNFGSPSVTDYRNPTLAMVAKELNFIQRFGSGIPRAKKALQENGNPPPAFELNENFVNVTIRKRR